MIQLNYQYFDSDKALRAPESFIERNLACRLMYDAQQTRWSSVNNGTCSSCRTDAQLNVDVPTAGRQAGLLQPIVVGYRRVSVRLRYVRLAVLN